MFFRLSVLTTLVLTSNSFAGGTEQCPLCPAKEKNGALVKGRCKNAAGGGTSKEYKTITEPNPYRCNEACQIEGDACRGLAFRSDQDVDNCLLYSYRPTKVKGGRDNADDFECFTKGPLRDYSFVGDGLCEPRGAGGRWFTQLRAYRGGEIDGQNPLGTIDSIEQCAEFCNDDVDIEDEFNYQPGVTKCQGFNFENERCINSFGETDNRCSTNCYLYAAVQTGNRTRPSRVRNYDGWTCYTNNPGSGCSCD